jgi:hypothetical protein
METKEERKLELRGVSIVAAVVIALMGFSAALGTRPAPEAAATEAPAAQADHRDPSLAGLSVAADAEPGGDVEMYY